VSPGFFPFKPTKQKYKTKEAEPRNSHIDPFFWVLDLRREEGASKFVTN
jgi:hypothetical protein